MKNRYTQDNNLQIVIVITMQSMSSRSLIHGLFYGKERILLVFATYGLAAGMVTAIDSMSHNPDIYSVLSLPMNFPTFVAALIVFGEHYAIPVPILFWNVIVVLLSVAVWTTIGFIVYSAYRLFKLGP